ncbi:MAG: TadE/TadG family type IV pilus assembly protein [Pseudomonadota bacterium]
MRGRFGRSRRALKGDRRGTVTIEFMLALTPFLLLLLGIIEVGMVAFSSATLRNGTYDAARIVRTNSGGCVSQDEIETLICQNTVFAPNCTERLEATRRVMNGAWGSSSGELLGTEGDPDDDQVDGGDVVVVTAVYRWRAVSPLISAFIGNEDGELLMNQRFVFQTEPFGATTCPAG